MSTHPRRVAIREYRAPSMVEALYGGNPLFHGYWAAAPGHPLVMPPASEASEGTTRC
jgi:hypothetical protein